MIRAVVALLSCCFAIPINAEELFPRFTLTGGAYHGDFSTDIRADNNALAGTQLNAERDLGLARSERLQRFGIQWRPFARHEFAASWFRSTRSGFVPLNAPITFNGQVYPARAEVTTNVGLKYWDATYTGWLHRSDRSGIGLTLGVAALAIDASLFAQRPGQTLTITETASTRVPVALGGLQARIAIARNVFAAVSGGVLPRVHIDTYSGHAVTGRALLEYRLMRYLGVGASYNYFRLSGTVTDPQFAGDLSMTIKGPEGFVRLIF